ncbi:hypothetical protein VCRA2119O147_60089 [Vibrio crassostreae]|nr:hypothetical protein VCRA2111O320_100012 [Vibrio crassostreae]CAK1708717.1 hypothetical protein VCRA2116O28_110006 [Vibrio crassostreae]CAK1751296.1 hypothetical protein VCRA2116O233_140017 [Vibrio crassostreae]CAK1756264.1 hypothetical protein VCRA2116O26_130130 [Vibrio crassostreae]CAK1757377.1 hypothetical protein VCRA2119O46_130130 [Vibrio crassostreae]
MNSGNLLGLSLLDIDSHEVFTSVKLGIIFVSSLSTFMGEASGL